MVERELEVIVSLKASLTTEHSLVARCREDVPDQSDALASRLPAAGPPAAGCPPGRECNRICIRGVSTWSVLVNVAFTIPEQHWMAHPLQPGNGDKIMFQVINAETPSQLQYSDPIIN